MKWRLVVGIIDELTGLAINPPPIPGDGTSGDTTTRRGAPSHTSALRGRLSQKGSAARGVANAGDSVVGDVLVVSGAVTTQGPFQAAVVAIWWL
jgi:hypothetical protein